MAKRESPLLEIVGLLLRASLETLCPWARYCNVVVFQVFSDHTHLHFYALNARNVLT